MVGIAKTQGITQETLSTSERGISIRVKEIVKEKIFNVPLVMISML